MVEAVVVLVIWIVEAVVHALAAIVELFVGLFVAGAEGLGILDLLALVAVFCLELVFWLCLATYEVLRAILQRRRVQRVGKPVFWRPSKLKNPPSDRGVQAEGKKPEVP